MTRGWMQERHPGIGEVFAYRVEGTGDRCTVHWDGEALELEVAQRGPAEGWCRWQGQVLPFALAWVDDELHLWLDGSLFIFQQVERQQRSRGTLHATGGELVAPVTGRVLRLLVRPGDRVEQEQPVLIIESMKMEHVLLAPRAGIVRQVSVQEGSPVERGMLLLDLEDEEDTS